MPFFEENSGYDSKYYDNHTNHDGQCSRPMYGVPEQAAGHDRIKPGNPQPGKLANSIGKGVQPGSFVVIGRHFITKCHEGSGVNGISQEKQDRHGHEEAEIVDEEIFALAQLQ